MARKSAPALQTTGTVIQVAGYAAAPFTGEGSLALVGAGKIVEKTGTAVQVVFDAYDGKLKDVGYTVTSELIFGILGIGIDKAEKAKKITTTDSEISNFVPDTWGKVADFFYDKSKTKK